jgi:hypothetical protein
MGKSNRAARVEQKAKSLMSGWVQDAKGWGPTIHVDGKVLSRPEIISKLRDIQDLHRAVRTCQKALTAAVAARDRAHAKNRAFIDNVDQMVRLGCGNNLKRLATYGLAPIKRRGTLSPEKAVVAKTLEKRTRAARGIKGSRQRKAIKAAPQPRVVIEVPGGTPTKE